MRALKHFVELFRVGRETAEFTLARFAVLSRQIPIMYAIVSANMVALAVTYYGKAPFVLTVIAPAILVAVSFIRSVKIIQTDPRAVDVEAARRQFRMIVVFSGVLGALFVLWSLLLFGYGDAYAKGQVTFFIGLTVIVVMSSLMPLPQVSLIMFGVVVVPAAVFLAAQPEPSFRAISLNMLLVTGVMAIVLFRGSAEFKNSVERERRLKLQHEELRNLNAEVTRLANEDSLTEQPNRRRFLTMLDEIIAERAVSRKPFVVGVIDLDGFKPVNDVFGHPCGDRVLRAAGQRLRAALPADAFLARLGGDEFAIILPDVTDANDAIEMVQDCLHALAEPFATKEGSATISGTAGLAEFPFAGQTGAQLFERADYALYFAKENHRGQAILFSEKHETIILEVSTIGQRLREAKLDAEFTLEFQPIVDSSSGIAVGMEALARWTSPSLGKVSPELFIRSAEQSGIMNRLTLTLLKKALRLAKEWPKDVYLSFNLSAHDTGSAEAVDAILDVVATEGFDTRRLVFEITETAIMRDFEQSILALKRFHEKGISIALDDFGTGYSSLSYLRRLPVDRIKVDRSFVQDIERDKAAMDIVVTIVGLCKSLDLECIVEGIETESQLLLLQMMGCATIQGYFFSRPIDSVTAARYLHVQGQAADVRSQAG